MNQQTRAGLQQDRERLARDMRVVVDEAEQLLRGGARGAGEAIASGAASGALRGRG
jgi:hypothetical protein